MAITVGNISNSGNPGAVTSYSWAHTCAVGTTLLVVAIGGEDTSTADLPVSSVTYNGQALTKARENAIDPTNPRVGSIWYLINPTTGSSLSIAVTHAGKVTDTAAGAIDLLGTATTNPFDNYSEDAVAFQASSTVTPAATNSILIAVGFNAAADTNVTPQVGTKTAWIDLGAVATHVGYVFESGGTALFRWQSISAPGAKQNCTFKVGDVQPPYVPTVTRITRNLVGPAITRMVLLLLASAYRIFK